VAPNLFIALTNPIEGEDDAFNKWYDAQHVPEVLDVPGVVAAQRYDITELQVPDDQDLPAQLPPPTHRYMVIYELDNEPDIVMAEFLKRVMAGTDCGFDTSAGMGRVTEDVVWAKMKAMADGAKIASQRLSLG